MRMQGCSAHHEGGMDQGTKRGEMPSIPGAAVLSEETQAWSRRACYVRRQVPGDKCGIVRLAFPVSLMCMCRRYSECTCGVGGKLCLCGNSIYSSNNCNDWPGPWGNFLLFCAAFSTFIHNKLMVGSIAHRLVFLVLGYWCLVIALDQIGHDNSVRARCCVLLLARCSQRCPKRRRTENTSPATT